MRSLFSAFWKEESGFIVSAELVLVATICTIALVVGLTQVSMSINNELHDLASAFNGINQSYGTPQTGYADQSNTSSDLSGSAPSGESGQDFGG